VHGEHVRNPEDPEPHGMILFFGEAMI